MWEKTGLANLLPLQRYFALRDEHILREILVRFSCPPLTWRQSVISDVYIEEKKRERKPDETDAELEIKAERGEINGWSPKVVYYYEEDPRIKLIFCSVRGRVYSKTLPASAVRWLLANAIRQFYIELLPALESVPLSPPYCPDCGKKMIDYQGWKWKCPELHAVVLQSEIQDPCGLKRGD